jgi:hypothetical protein
MPGALGIRVVLVFRVYLFEDIAHRFPFLVLMRPACPIVELL